MFPAAAGAGAARGDMRCRDVGPSAQLDFSDPEALLVRIHALSSLLRNKVKVKVKVEVHLHGHDMGTYGLFPAPVLARRRLPDTAVRVR